MGISFMKEVGGHGRTGGYCLSPPVRPLVLADKNGQTDNMSVLILMLNLGINKD